MDSLPVIDYSEKDRASQSRRIVNIMSSLGFLFLENVPGYSEDDLRWCVDFFFKEMPAAKKLQVARALYNPESKQLYRGYFGVNKVGSSFKEAFEIGKDMSKNDPDYESSFPISENNIWPEADEGQDNEPYVKFKEVMMRYHKLLLEVSLDLVKLISMGLGLKENYFDCLFTKNISTLRLINYPVHNFEIPKDAYGTDGKLLSTAQHRDTSILTLLTTFDYEGLQVEREDSTWLDVVPRKNSLVVNLGDILSRMTKNRVKATIHRVLAIGRPRQSVPFFLEPSYHALIPNQLPEDLSLESAADYPKEDSFEYGPFMIEYIQRFVEYRGFFKKK